MSENEVETLPAPSKPVGELVDQPTESSERALTELKETSKLLNTDLEGAELVTIYKNTVKRHDLK